jgi:hypothetical protein
MLVIAHPAKETGAVKCPRCLRFTKNDGPEVACSDGERGIVCWRCQHVLVVDHPHDAATELVREWRESAGLPNF